MWEEYLRVRAVLRKRLRQILKGGGGGVYSCGGPFMCIIPSDGGPHRPEGPGVPELFKPLTPEEMLTSC